VRRETLGDLSLAGANDVSEMGIAANATGLMPDTPELHHPVLRTVELPEVLCPEEDGGILQRRGAIEVISCLRTEHEAEASS
jgi:predicted homoserine dehydrogenase-like protein